LVLTRRTIALAASFTLAAPALAGEPGGFRVGLYLGETAAACAVGVPVAVGGFYFAALYTSISDDAYD
jgi:hypothetical protein